ncbi:MAG: HIT family protein [Actinomycetota bacterium]|nr:HIT family protein [Actinomycetota bacterium]
MSGDCTFCAIVAGDQPHHRVREDADTVAFLDVHPATRGHTLVVPRRHVRDLWDADQDVAARVMRAGWVVARLARDRLGADGVNLFQATGEVAFQSEFHLHLHVVPRYDREELVRPWSPLLRADDDELGAVADVLRGG